MPARKTEGQLIEYANHPEEHNCPSWLILPNKIQNPFLAKEWFIVDKIERHNEIDVKQTRINFNQNLPGGCNLLDKRWESSRRALQWYLLLLRRGANSRDFGRLATTCTGHGQAQNASLAFNLIRYLALQGLSGWSQLTDVRANELLRKIVYGIGEFLEINKLVNKWIEARPVIPYKHLSGNMYGIDFKAVAENIGVTVQTFRESPEARKKIQSLAKEQGLYIIPSHDSTNKTISNRDIASPSTLAAYIRVLQGIANLRLFDLGEEVRKKLSLPEKSFWPGKRPIILAEQIHKNAAKKNTSKINIKARNNNNRTPSLNAKCGLKLINEAVNYILRYADKLLEIRDLEWPREIGVAEELVSINSKVQIIRNNALIALNRKLVKNNPDNCALCPWPFRGAATNQKSEISTQRRYHYTKEELSSWIGRIKSGEVTWQYVANELGLPSGNTVKQIWNRVNERYSPQYLAGRPSLHIAVNNLLPAACYIVLAAFSARRECELLDIRADCISHDKRYIEIYSAKYLRDWQLFPCVPIMKLAVEILLRWSEPARKHSGNSRIFQQWLAFHPKPKVAKFYTQKSLKEFANYAQVDIKDIYGEEVPLSDHQFRRLFANLFLHKYCVGVNGKLEALSHQLRHLDPAVTEHYVRESISGQVFDEIQLEQSADIMTKILTGKVNTQGKYAGRLSEIRKRLLRRFDATIEVATTSQAKSDYEQWLNRKVWNHVAKIQMSIIPLAWGHCFGRSLPLRKYCKCNSEAERSKLSVPNISNANMNTCKSCPCILHLDEHLPCIKSWEDTVLATVNNESTPPVLKAACENYNKQQKLGKIN